MINGKQYPSLLFLVSSLWLVGCEINPQEEAVASTAASTESVAPASSTPEPTATAKPESTPAPAPEPEPEPTPDPVVSTGGADDLDISSADLLGPHDDDDARTAPITRTMHSANVEGGNVRMSYDDLGWPTRSGSKTTDGGVYIFWLEGSQVVGGFFDHHGVGQKVKTLGNVHGGYLDGRQPPTGATVYFALVSYECDQRTNVKRSESTW